MVTLNSFVEWTKLNKETSLIPKALRLTRSIKTSTTVLNRPKLDESFISETLLKSPPNDDDLKIMLADNLAHLAWDSLTKEDLDDIKQMNKLLLINGYVSLNYLIELINKILFKVCDENRIKQKLNKIDKVYKKAIILVANHLLSLCSESEPKCVTDEKINIPKKKPCETEQKINHSIEKIKMKKSKSSSEEVNKPQQENTQAVSIPNKITINVPDKPLKLPKKFSKGIIKNKKIKVSEEIQKSFLETRKKGVIFKEVKERIDDLIHEASKLGLGEIKFPKRIYANERAKLALLERQIKGKIRLRLIDRGLKSEHKIKAPNATVTK